MRSLSLALLTLLVDGGGLFTGRAPHRRAELDAAADALARAHGLVSSRSLLSGPVLHGAFGRFHVVIAPRRPYLWSRCPIAWRFEVRPLALAARTAMRLWPQGASLSAAMQGSNVTTGDPDFDERLRIWGSEPDVVRAVIEHGDVKEALSALYRLADIEEVALHPIGVLEVRLEPLAPEVTPSSLLKACLSLACAFEVAAEGAPRARRLLDRRGIGSESGCPVGVPTSS